MNGHLSILLKFVGRICRMKSESDKIIAQRLHSDSCVDSSDEDDGLIQESSSGPVLMSRSIKRTELECKIDTRDEMTELISLQKSNGLFEISNKEWKGSVLEKYLGPYTEVRFGCPLGMKTYLWITALSMKILEIKMSDKKDLWDLVAQKSEKFLKEELKQEMENYKSLIDLAEKYVKSK